MICNKKCLRKEKYQPIANIVSDSSFVCICFNNKKQDKFRHCFKSMDTDSIFDYDEYDLISVINIFTESLLMNELMKKI